MSTWVLIDPEAQEIIVSKTPETVTGITHVKPKDWTLHSGKPVVLHGTDRSFTERVLIGQGQLARFNAKPADQLVKNTDSSETSEYRLDLHHADGAKRRLHFHDLARLQKEHPETNDGKRIPDAMPAVEWELKASAVDFARFANASGTRWINGMGTYFNRPQNRSVGFQITNDGLTLEWWWDKDAKAFMKSFDIPFDQGSSIKMDGFPELLELAPKDAMLMFAGIADLPLTSSQVVFQGTKDGLYLTYETDLAAYRSFLPAKWQYDKEDKAERAAAKKRSRSSAKGGA